MLYFTSQFNPQCLVRRSGPEDTASEWSPSEIALWTSHRVMEWLRSIDLSEYAPNLRGSGVHGALVIYEHAFNSDLLATLLSIPTSKTLLRRHISIKFKFLIGNDLCRVKRDLESHPNYVAMVPGAKVKVGRPGRTDRKDVNHSLSAASQKGSLQSAQETQIRRRVRGIRVSDERWFEYGITNSKSFFDSQRELVFEYQIDPKQCHRCPENKQMSDV